MKDQTKLVINYILSATAAYADTPLTTRRETVQHIKDRFLSEYGHEVKTVGIHRAMISWLQGLPLPLPYTDHEILVKTKEWGSLPSNPTEKQEEKIVKNYWSFMATQILKLFAALECKKSKLLD